MRRAHRIGVPVWLVLAASGAAWGWGFVGHRIIVEEAMASLPPELAGWYEGSGQQVSDASLQPDTVLRRNEDEGRNHFLNLELLGEPPWIIPLEEPDPSLRTGRLPWRVVEIYDRLVEAFLQKDADEVIRMSGWLSHYVSDAYQPLHTTVNYDGQLTGNDGVHKAFEAELVARSAAAYREALAAHRLETSGRKPIKDPGRFIREEIRKNSRLVAELLEQETRAASAAQRGSDDYFRHLEEFAGSLARAQMRAAAKAVALFWYSAWEEADRPQPPSGAIREEQP